MKIRISWDSRECDGITAKSVLADPRFKVTRYVGNGLVAGDVFDESCLQFNVADYSEGRPAVDEIQWLLGVHWKIFTRVSISTSVPNGIDWFCSQSEYFSRLEADAQRRKIAMEDAIALLKNTASWFKDRRIAAIRRLLEEKL